MSIEYWLRGPVAGIPAALQPVAHALLQSRAEVNALMEGFPEENRAERWFRTRTGEERRPAEVLWERPAGVASPGFHLQHLAGVLDRLLTYARGEMLSPRQLEELGEEDAGASDTRRADGVVGQGRNAGEASGELDELLERYNNMVDKALLQMAGTPESSLTEPRGVGRAQIPSTVGGLLFHAAEHSMRHTGQLLVTIKILTTNISSGNR